MGLLSLRSGFKNMQSEPINFNDTETAFAYRTTEELKNSHFVFASMNNPLLVKAGTGLMNFALKAHLPIKGLIKKTLFNQFCGGESIIDCEQTIQLLGKYNVHTILDYSVEGVESEEGYDAALAEALRVVEFASDSKHIPFVVMKPSGFGNTNLMTRFQEGNKLSDIEIASLGKVKKRIHQIIESAASKGLMVMVDAEESWFQDFIDSMVYELMEVFNKEQAIVYNTFQLYRHDTISRLENALDLAKGKYHLGAKLVRGAYMEKERDQAKEEGYPSPIHINKANVDRDYDHALKVCMDNIHRMGLCAGTHNEDSSKYLTELIEQKGLQKEDQRVYFAQLLGMSDNISFKLSGLGYNVAKYVPYGPIDKVLPYLTRRAEENTSIAGQSSREFSLIKKELQRRKN